MIARIALCLLVLVLVGLVLVYLVGPILIATSIPFIVILGEFCEHWGWVLALVAAALYFFSGRTLPWRA